MNSEKLQITMSNELQSVCLTYIVDQVKLIYQQVQVDLKPKTNSIQLYLSDYSYWIEVWAYDSDFRLWVVAHDKTINLDGFVYDQDYGKYCYYKNAAKFSYDYSSMEDSNRLLEIIVELLKLSSIKQSTMESAVSSQVDQPYNQSANNQPVVTEYVMPSELNQRLLRYIIRDNSSSNTIFKQIDPETTTAEQYLDLIANGNWDIKWEDITDDKNELRGLKNINKNAKNAHIERGYLWATSLCNIMIDRSGDNLKNVEGNHLAEFTKSPYDIDYQIPFDNIEQILEGLVFENEAHQNYDGSESIDELVENGKKYRESTERSAKSQVKPKSKIFSVKTLENTDGGVPCSICDSSGSIRCSKCNGSGRESYVDGYFADGSEKIKTGQCSMCFGTGKIICKSCAGSGKHIFHADKYQQVRSCAELTRVLKYNNYTTSFGDNCSFSTETSMFMCDDEAFTAEALGLIAKHDLWAELDANELSMTVVSLYQSKGKAIVDNKMPDCLFVHLNDAEQNKKLYAQNIKAARDYWKSQKLSFGELVCAMELNCVVPMTKLTFSAKSYGGDSEFEYYFISAFIENNNVLIPVCYILPDKFPISTFLKSLF